MRQQKGFTLMELMMAVALVAILTMVAMPNYRNYMQRADRADAQAILSAGAGALERYKSQRFSYSGADTADLVPTRAPTSAAPGQQKYTITLTVTASTFLITAVSTSRFASSNQKEVLTIDQAGNRCYHPLSVATTNVCDLATDQRW